MNKAQRDDLIEEFMPEVAEIAAEFEDDDLTEEDILQEGMLGLVESVNALAASDSDEWPISLDEMIREAIRGAIRKAIDENRALKREDDAVAAKLELLDQSIDRLTEKNGTKPNIDEIANEMELSQEMVLALLKLTGETPDDEMFFRPGNGV